LGRTLIRNRELLQGLVERHEILARLRNEQLGFVHGLTHPAATPFDAAFTSSVFDQDAAHGLSGRSEEVAAAVPVRFRLGADDSQVRLMNEGRGIERLANRFVGQSVCRQPSQLVIDQRQELRRGIRIPRLNILQKIGNVAHGTILVEGFPPVPVSRLGSGCKRGVPVPLLTS
jgi:hypothetical protein